MPIYSNLGKAGGIGVSGYSGENPIIISDEILSQNNLTPDVTNWTLTGDVEFVDDVLTVNTEDNYTFIEQSYDLFNKTMEAGEYRATIVLQNINIENLGDVFFATNYTYNVFIPENGINIIDFIQPKVETYAITMGVDAGIGGFEIISISLKPIRSGSKGESGYSGYSGMNIPKITEITDATEETFITKFNLLLDELIAGGYMEQPTP